MESRSIRNAVSLALEVARGRPLSPPANGVPRRFRVAIGDPQAPLERFLTILGRGGLLTDSGRLRPEVQLLSIGDHFDWGTRDERAQATREGLAILAWLAMHPADQVLLCAGNHDLARVGEHASLDDEAFARIRAEADAAYVDGRSDRTLERTFLQRAPMFPSVEVASRDLSTFSAAQRDWVGHLLSARRLRLAHALGPSLLASHAGITLDELSAIGVAPALAADAPRLARALNLALDTAWALRRPQRALHIPGLYRAGSAAGREGAGMVYHRAMLSGGALGDVGGSTPRRRYPPARLPAGLTQVIGHVRDKKSRELFGLPTAHARDGVLRQLTVTGHRVDYSHGTRGIAGADEAVVLHIDGGMRSCPAAEYQLLDVDRLEPWEPARLHTSSDARG